LKAVGFHLIAPVYRWSTDGFDTLDLKEAKALLDALASQRQARAGATEPVWKADDFRSWPETEPSKKHQLMSAFGRVADIPFGKRHFR
jgi:hypothetical protein